MIEFTAWPKTPRLLKGMTITEKIDGSNAAVHIRPTTEDAPHDPNTVRVEDADGELWVLAAQSRKRLITPTVDNFGFAAWAYANAPDLVELLGEGLHFGEWWGSGIQRGYGLTKGERRFSLFNVDRYEGIEEASSGLLRTVPLLARYPMFSTVSACMSLDWLGRNGSLAAPGFDNPEGVMVWHEAARQVFKLPFDEAHKGETDA